MSMEQSAASGCMLRAKSCHIQSCRFSGTGEACVCLDRSTNYKKWFSSAEPYAIKFKSGYEPYVLVARKIMPWYDERFRGYGWDKVKTYGSQSRRRAETSQSGAAQTQSKQMLQRNLSRHTTHTGTAYPPGFSALIA